METITGPVFIRDSFKKKNDLYTHTIREFWNKETGEYILHISLPEYDKEEFIGWKQPVIISIPKDMQIQFLHAAETAVEFNFDLVDKDEKEHK